MARTVLITGASSGIGAATARTAAAEGWNVVLAARREDELAALAEEIGDAAHACRCDVTDLSDQERAVAEAEERFGSLEAAFANAGRGGAPGGFSGADPASWRGLVDVNILGVAYTVRAALPALKRSRGHMVLTGSVAGRRTLAGSMYSVTKWAVHAIGYNLREELRGTGVRVTVVEPGMVDTAFFDEPKPDALRPEDVASAVVYAIGRPAHVDLHEIMVLPTPPVGE